MNQFRTLTKQQIEEEELPLINILTDSFYYPSSGFDGGIVKDCNTKAQDLNITSFIYCDYSVGAVAFETNKDSFVGYHVLGSRHVEHSELIPNGWQPVVPPDVSRDEYLQTLKHWKSFCTWTIYERDSTLGNEHGPDRFSLLFIGGEGVATYQALYWSNKITAKALALIQPGTGFGLNWTNFKDQNGALSWVINNNPAGKPNIIYYGGYSNHQDGFNWDGFVEDERKIFPYYHGHGGMVKIFKRETNQ